MTRNEYIMNVDNARGEIFNTPFDEIKNLGLYGAYSLISASILRYLSHFKNEEHYKLIQEIQFNRNLALIDQYYFELITELQVTDPENLLEEGLHESKIFVTYHTGSYRLFIQLLGQRNIPFCLVTEESFIDEQQQMVNEIYKRTCKYFNQGDNKELEIIKAEDPKLLFKLNDKLKNGVSVVFYIDGNTGVNSHQKVNSNLLKIKFLDHFIMARQGIALLAYLSKRPLVSAVGMRHPGFANSIEIKSIDDTLFKQITRKEYVPLITGKLYAELEEFLRKHPEQWEGWFYIDRFKPEEEVTDQKLTFKKDTEIIVYLDDFVEILREEEHIFLITKRNFTIRKISNVVDDILSYFKDPKSIIVGQTIKVNEHDINFSIIEELLDMKVLAT